MHTSTEYTDNRSADRAGFFFDMYKFKSCGILCQQYLAAETIRIKNVLICKVSSGLRSYVHA